MNFRDKIKDKKRIVVKIGTSSLTHKETGHLNLAKLEKLVRVLTDLRNSGKDVILVSSGAIGVGRTKLGLLSDSLSVSEKQACAAVGQAQLMMIYQKLFSQYNQSVAQILMTKITVVNDLNRHNAINTFNELLKLGVIPIVNENDTVSTYEIQFGDNDRLSALVSSLVGADLLILLSDIDGLFTDDPNVNKDAKFIDIVTELSDTHMFMGKNTSTSNRGTGGMAAKLVAAQIATCSGTDMIIANGEDVSVIEKIMNGDNVGTLFVSNEDKDFDMIEFIS
jgi:glutamate 5-kinase